MIGPEQDEGGQAVSVRIECPGGAVWRCAALVDAGPARTACRLSNSPPEKDAEMLSSARIQQRLAQRSIALVPAGGRGTRLKSVSLFNPVRLT